jgi:hypothetical protein
MSRFLFVAGLAASLVASGCSIHPLPEDVTGVSTYHIVRQIRCEARDTLRRIVIKYLHTLGDHGLSLAEQLALQYETDPSSIRGFHYNLFKGPALVEVRAPPSNCSTTPVLPILST